MAKLVLVQPGLDSEMKLAPVDRDLRGPFDSSEVGLLAPHLDFGSLRISPKEGLQIRAEVDEITKRIVALTLELENHKLQLQAFSAPTKEGMWEEVMQQTISAIQEQNGTVELLESQLGKELRVTAPVSMSGQVSFKETRVVGVDGPRWFLRGIFSGEELYSTSRYLTLVELFRSVVVHRGDFPIPPGELLPITLPVQEQA